MSETNWVWSFNERLPEFGEDNNNINDAVREYYKYTQTNHSLPLKNVIDSIYYDLNIPIDIINLITIYNSGGIVYNYSKRFEQFTQNTVYVIPIILGYCETFLFVFMCLFELIIKQSIWITSLIYAILLLIHGICALITFNKCKKYEIIIRNFKRSLYSNDNFIRHVHYIDNKNRRTLSTDNAIVSNGDHDKDIDTDTVVAPTADRTNLLSNINSKRENEIETENENDIDIIYDKDDWHWTSTYKEEQDSSELLSTILNPSNNTFAYIAYQRWSNVKKLELRNDSFTRSKSALCLSLSKYWLPSYYIISVILLVYTPYILSIFWGIIFFHSFYIIMYCYYRVIEHISHRRSLLISFVFALFQDIVFISITLIVFLIPSSSSKDNDDDDDKSNHDIFIWAFGVIFPVIYVIMGLISLSWLLRVLYSIIKHNRHTISVNDTNGAYRFWLYCFVFVGSICTLLMCLSWRYLNTSILLPSWRSFLMIIVAYMIIQQLIHRIITGMNKEDYIKNNIENNPRLWLKNELKLLFIPYIK